MLAFQPLADAGCRRSTAHTDRWRPELPRSGSQRSTPTIDPKRTLTLTFESGSLVRARIARDAHHQLSAMLFDDLCKNEVEMLGGVKTIGATGEILWLLLCGIDVFHDAKAKLSQVDGQPARIET